MWFSSVGWGSNGELRVCMRDSFSLLSQLGRFWLGQWERLELSGVYQDVFIGEEQPLLVAGLAIPFMTMFEKKMAELKFVRSLMTLSCISWIMKTSAVSLRRIQKNEE